jgi:predicted DNA-binding transcriptional regulator AlpA
MTATANIPAPKATSKTTKTSKTRNTSKTKPVTPLYGRSRRIAAQHEFSGTVTKTQVAIFLKTHEACVDRMVRNGDFLRPLKIGTATRWRAEDVIAFVAQAAAAAASTPKPVAKK